MNGHRIECVGALHLPVVIRILSYEAVRQVCCLMFALVLAHYGRREISNLAAIKNHQTRSYPHEYLKADWIREKNVYLPLEDIFIHFGQTIVFNIVSRQKVALHGKLKLIKQKNSIY